MNITKINIYAYKWFLGIVGRSQDKTSKNLFRLFQFAIYATATVFLLNILSFFGEPSFGTFGDFFGGVLNPILTFLTFMGLLITIILQQRELSLTREELKVSSRALTEQSITLEKQRFEDTFFALFSQHNEILKTITASGKGKWSDGKSDILQVHKQCFQSETSLSGAKRSLMLRNDLVGHYYRVLYQLLKLIATRNPDSSLSGVFNNSLLLNSIASENEKMYANIVRAVLNHEVTQLLAINCYSNDENDQYKKYKTLIIRYQFLEHMPFHTEYSSDRYNKVLKEGTNYYGKYAFGDNMSVTEMLTKKST